MVEIMESFEEIKQKSHSVVLEIMPNVSSEELLDDVDLFSLGLDSINAMMLVMNLQDAFGVTFETCEINVDNFRTLANIVELIKNKQGVSLPL
jgi:acyl carrier protein